MLTLCRSILCRSLLLSLAVSESTNSADSIAAASSSTRDTFVVTGSRTGVPLHELGGSVITRADIAPTLPYTALDAIDDVAGVTAFHKGGAGGSSYLSIRGGEPNYTLVLLDGVRMNDPTNSQGGSFDMSQIDPVILERIDIYRGGLSAVHGADALSGVVNLQLRSFAGSNYFQSTRVVTDTENGKAISGSLGTGWSEGGLLFSASWADSGDITEPSTQSRRQFLARITQQIDVVDVATTLLHGSSDRRSFPEDSGGVRLAQNRELETVASELTIFNIDIKRANPAPLRPRVKANWSKQTADADTPAIFPGVLDYVPPITADTDFRRGEITADVGVDVSETLTALAGAGYIKENGRSRGTVDFGALIPAGFDIERSIASAFVELSAQPLPRANITLGARRDDPSTQAPEWTSRLSLSYQPSEQRPSLYLNWSQGYKLPSLYALAYPLIANPDLKPERSRGVDIGIRHQADAGTEFRIGYFRTKFVDMIDFDANTFTNVNRAWVESSGVEAEIRQPLSRSVTARINATYMDTDAIGGIKLRSRPQWQGGADLRWVAGERLHTYISAQYRGSDYDSSIPTGLVSTGSYLTVDTGITMRLLKNVEMSLALKNLLDKDYEETLGTPAPGRLARIALSWDL